MSMATTELNGRLCECQNCGLVVPYSDDLDLCERCGAGHWRLPPTHYITPDEAATIPSYVCPVCGPAEACRFDAWDPVHSTRTNDEGDEVPVEPPPDVKKLLKQRGLLHPDYVEPDEAKPAVKRGRGQ